MEKITMLNMGVMFFCLALAGSGVGALADDSGSWRDASRRNELKNEALVAWFQSGLLYRLEDGTTGKSLLDLDPESLPAEAPLFGRVGIDLDACQVSVEVTADSVVSRFRSPGGTEWDLHWSIEPGRGDLVLQTAARSAEPVDRIQLVLAGCDIADHSLVVVDGNGNAQKLDAPWEGGFHDAALPEFGFSPRYVHPLVALFQGENSGWFLEGRDLRIGPANLLNQGKGQTATLVPVRGFPSATRTPRLFEIRIRAYQGDWQDAVDPYVDWMERKVGFVPLDKKPQKWVQNIRSQAYVNVGDFEGLQVLARRLDPAKTLLGRMGGYRPYAWDHNFPDYTPSEDAVRWFKRARELGFHVGAHVNTAGLDPSYSELVERFRRGFMEISLDSEGNETFTDPPPMHSGRIEVETKDGKRTYWGAPPTVLYTSTANKDWRDHLIGRLRPLVEAGVDMIYLDESMAPTGKFIVDGTTAIQGVMALEKEILEAYPHVVIETEQINLMNARWSSFALTTLDLGHPLGGYIYSRFVKFVPEGYFYEPQNEKHLNEFQSFGFLLPGANKERSWMDIANAFQDFDLAPVSRLPRKFYQLSGFRGPEGVVAYYEKHPRKRGLVVYVPAKAPRWFGARVTGVKTWAGPGGLRDWFLYDGATLLGLNPKQTYVFDETVTLLQDSFHVTRLPPDFAVHTKSIDLFGGQEVGPNGSFHKLTFTGTGEIEMFVPDDVHAFLDGEEVPADPATRAARGHVMASVENPTTLMAYRVSDTELAGEWVSLPWQTSIKQDPGMILAEGSGFFNHVGAEAKIIGRLPDATSIRLQGSWQMGDRPRGVGDAVVRINGQEVVRLPTGPKPYQLQSFDVDVSTFAGKHVFLEFAVDGEHGGFAPSSWYNPRIAVSR